MPDEERRPPQGRRSETKAGRPVHAQDTRPAGPGGGWRSWERRGAEATRPPDPDQDPEGYLTWRLEVLAAWGRWQSRSAA